MEPGRELGVTLEAVETLERVEERVLDDVARVFFGADDAARDRQQPAAIRSDHLFEGRLIAGAKLGNKRGFIIDRCRAGHSDERITRRKSKLAFQLQQLTRPLLPTGS
jgi:hypothetical protein